MKRGLYFFIIVLLTSFYLTACGNSDNKTGADGKKAEEHVELEMYSWRTEDKSAYNNIIEAFEEEHPDIKVNFKPFDATEYDTILTNALSSGEGPDIVQLRGYGSMKSIADNDYLLGLDDIEGVSDIDDSYLEAAKGSDESVYGVPLTLNSGVIFYNKEIFENLNLDPPETWDDLLEVSEELKNNDITPIAQAGRDAYLLGILHSVILPSVGGQEYLNDVVDGDADLTDSRMEESLDRIQELSDYFPEDFISLDDNDAQALFFSEEAAMYINGDYRLETFEKEIPDMSLGVVPGLVPDNESEPLVMNWVDGSYGVVEESEHQEEALKFMEFMTSQEFGQAFSDELNRVSPVKNVEPSHEIVKQINEAVEENSIPRMIKVYFDEGSPSTMETFENALQGLFLDEITTREVMEEAQENADRVEDTGE